MEKVEKKGCVMNTRENEREIPSMKMDVYIDIKITFQGDWSEEGRRSKNYELQRKIRAVAE